MIYLIRLGEELYEARQVKSPFWGPREIMLQLERKHDMEVVKQLALILSEKPEVDGPVLFTWVTHQSEEGEGVWGYNHISNNAGSWFETTRQYPGGVWIVHIKE